MLAPLIPFMYLVGIIDSMLTALNQQTSTLRYTTYIAVLSVLSIYFLLPFTGSKGYILILYVGTMIEFALMYSRLLTVTKIRAQMRRWFLLPGVCSILSCLSVRVLLPEKSPSLFHLISAMLLACGIFVVTYTMTHLIFQNKKQAACMESKRTAS
jgi:O-antigen/teichoic acid export membrane protein